MLFCRFTWYIINEEGIVMMKIVKRDHKNFIEKVNASQKTHKKTRIEIKDKKKSLEARINQCHRQNKER